MSDPFEVPISDVALAEGLTLEDSWYATKPLDDGTLAIGEPAYHQCNWIYLISDGSEALIWDTGSGRRPLKPLIERHIRGQVTAMPSHMHFDHLGHINEFGPVTLADLPMLRGLEKDGAISPPERMFLGQFEDLVAPSFEVGRWVAPGDVIEIGRRKLHVLHTPGHSPDSVSLWEPDRRRLYAGDFIYRGALYAQTPGACLPDYRAVLCALLKLLPSDVEIVGAHGQEEHGRFDVPLLGYGDLEDVHRSIEAVLSDPAHSGERVVNDHMDLLYNTESFTATRVYRM